MRDDDAFEFDPGQRGSSQLPAVLLAVAAIAAILIVNSTVLVPTAAASAHATPAASSQSLPAAPNGALRT
jgi:hypothetical protein